MIAGWTATGRVRLTRQARRRQAISAARLRSQEVQRWIGLVVLGLLALALASSGWIAVDRPDPAAAGPESALVAAAIDPQAGIAQLEQPLPSTLAETATAAPGSSAAQTARSQPPSLYELAGQTYGISPALLRALHVVESSAATRGCPANLEGSGALGPYQFMPATFRTFGRDADGNGRAEICSFPDALFSAAHYLQKLGADGETTSFATYEALRRYGTDPDRVLANLPDDRF